MTQFRKYQHIERFGTFEVEGIQVGECYVFPKIDGTNGTVWVGDDGIIHAGSRRRELTQEDDNAGFCKAILQNEAIVNLLRDYPHLRLYGEWLVPHTLRTYRDAAWRKFYVFDVVDTTEFEDVDDDHTRYVHYENYAPILERYGVEYIPPIKIISNGSEDQFLSCLDANQYLIKDGEGVGEGVVIKNYSFVNRYGRQTWAKIVRSEFKERHYKTMGAPEVACHPVEMQIAEEYITRALVQKEQAKIAAENGGWSSKMIPRLLGQIWYCLITEETWNFLKKFKSPTVDFKILNRYVTNQIKNVCPDIF